MWKVIKARPGVSLVGDGEFDGDRPAPPRRSLRLAVRFFEISGDGTAYFGHTTDVSATGVFVVTPSLLPVGTKIVVRPVNETEILEIEAEVVRHSIWPVNNLGDEAKGMGVRFLDPGGVEARHFAEAWEQFATRKFQIGRRAI